ncbi:MAG: alpha/beta fold hydrolase [Actinobacteria bacterium]|nr:alpha/beta fold hydrolase [Actinomycetota bacterium]
MGDSGKYAKYAVLAASCAGALALWRLHESPLPQEDLACLDRMDTRVETVHTDDGITLKLKRYVNEGGQPVLLAHGFLGNGLEFDLPHRRHNLALYLAERGYDVWISSFRGCGNGPYECCINDWGHSVDELAALDAPALIDGVTRATGKRPIWIGHSMGGMVLYMYLLGATVEMTNGSFRVVVDPSLANIRNASILGGITIGSPPSLAYGGGDWIAKLQRLPFYESQVGFLIRYLTFLGRFAPKLPNSRTRQLVTLFPRFGRIIAKRGPIAIGLYNPDNVDADVGYSLLKWAADNVTTGMTVQILSLGLDPEYTDSRKEYGFTANMHNITAPLFFITGTEDFAGAENIRTDGYAKVSSDKRRFENYAGYGHTDLVMGKRVYDEIYPDILDWVEGLSRPGAPQTESGHDTAIP